MSIIPKGALIYVLRTYVRSAEGSKIDLLQKCWSRSIFDFPEGAFMSVSNLQFKTPHRAFQNARHHWQ